MIVSLFDILGSLQYIIFKQKCRIICIPSRYVVPSISRLELHHLVVLDPLSSMFKPAFDVSESSFAIFFEFG